jgi:MFS family permease
VDADRQAGGASAGLVPLRRNRDFNLLWTGQAVSGLGSAMSGICYPLLILAITGSAAKAGIVGGVSLVTNLLLLLPAGVVADRYPRKRIMVITALAQLTVVGTVVPAAFAHHVYIAQLVAVGAVQGAASAFYIGASRGAMRRVVPTPQLSQAYARAQARDQAVSLVGAPAGGALFSLAQFLPFACDSFSFGCIAVATALIRTSLDPSPVATGPREPLRRSITTGLQFIFREPFLRTIALWGAGVNSVVAGMSLMVIVLARQHGATPTVIGLLLSVNAAAGVIGSLFAPRLVAIVGGRNLALAASWLLPAGAVGIAFAPSLWLIAVRGAVTMLMIAPVNVIFAAYAAQVTPDHLQAQAGNAMQLCVNSFGWLALPVFGVLADSLGIRSAILVGAGLFALIAVGIQFAPHLDQLDRKDAGQEGAS